MKRVHSSPAALRAQYAAAEPFPHIVLDGLFDDAELEAVLRDFPGRQWMQWMEFDNPLEKKLGYFHAHSRVSKTIRDFLNEMNGFETLLWLEALPASTASFPIRTSAAAVCMSGRRWPRAKRGAG